MIDVAQHFMSIAQIVRLRAADIIHEPICTYAPKVKDFLVYEYEQRNSKKRRIDLSIAMITLYLACFNMLSLAVVSKAGNRAEQIQELEEHLFEPPGEAWHTGSSDAIHA
jgi:hypothetical protein